MIVDAAESLFTPLCIYNNTQDDADAKTRLAFEEPAWNNPGVRIVDAAGDDVVPRLAGDWSLGGLANAMTAALGERGETVAPYLALLAQEEASRRSGVESAVFGMT
ncbi:MAG: hypothetical protein ACYTG6_12835 [Planctomycetota bacterium]|jgi:hypothetical protein